MIITAVVSLLSILLVVVLACPWRHHRYVSEYDRADRCRVCREHIADPHADGCRNDFDRSIIG